MTNDEKNLLDSAVELHRRGELDAAREVHVQLLAANPANVRALHYGALVSFQRGQHRLAAAMVSHALFLDPDYTEARRSLTGLLHHVERPPESADAYGPDMATELTEPPVRANPMSRSKRAAKEAKWWYLGAIEEEATDPFVRMSYAGLLEQRRRSADALVQWQAFDERVFVDEAVRESLLRRHLEALRRLGRRAESGPLYERLLDMRPADATLRHMLAAVTGENVPAKPDAAYVRELFDKFAGTFDEVLGRIDYEVPALVGELVDGLVGRDRERQGGESGERTDGTLRVLDAGCGTGLCGPHLRPVAAVLAGVDLSSEMLARAEETGVYDTLHEAEIVAFLQRAHERWDLIVSADTFCYFGALEELLEVLAGALAPNGRLVFTVEHWAEAAPTGYVLQPHGRYAHTRDAVNDALARAGADRAERRGDRGQEGVRRTGTRPSRLRHDRVGRPTCAGRIEATAACCGTRRSAPEALMEGEESERAVRAASRRPVRPAGGVVPRRRTTLPLPRRRPVPRAG